METRPKQTASAQKAIQSTTGNLSQNSADKPSMTSRPETVVKPKK